MSLSNTDTATAHDGGGATGASSNSLLGAVVLGCLLAVSLIVGMMYVVGAWDVLSLTRLLDLLIATRIVQYRDMLVPGFIQGIPDPELYFNTMQPIDWRLVFAAALLFVGFSALKATQFHGIARAYGLPGTLGQHMRAYFYGDGLDRFLPFNIGGIGTAAALVKLGAPFDRAMSAVVVSHSFMIFEIAVFGTLGLAMLGWGEWFSEVFWALFILGTVYFVVRRDGNPDLNMGRASLMAGLQAFSVLAQRQPMVLIKLCLLSIFAFAVIDFGIYIVMEAFTQTIPVDFSVEVPYLLIAIVGGYIVRLVPLTPGAIGQFELGFAAGFYVAGGDLSMSLFIMALLANILRFGTSALLMGGVTMWYGVPAHLSTILNIFKGADPAKELA